MSCPYRILFMEGASDEAIISDTRRPGGPTLW
jgi:hypothetical protein